MASKEKSVRQELLVGIFTAASVIGLITMVFVLNKTIVMASNNEYTVTFGFIDGLETAAPVRYAGLTVGKVEAIEYCDTSSVTRMLVRIRVRDDITLREDVRAGINTLGMIGEKYIELLPVSDTATPVRDKGTIRGTNPLMMQEIFRRVERIVNGAQETIDGVNNMVTDSNVQDQVRSIIANADRAMAGAKALTDSLNAVVLTNQDDVRGTVRNVRITTDSWPALQAQLRKTVADIDAAALRADTFVSHADGMTRENRENIQKVIANLETTSRNLKAFSAEIEANPWMLLRTP